MYTTKKRILIVDDEPDVLSVLNKGLLAHGYSVLQASTGREAIDIAINEHPDLIILDVDLPDIGGGDVASILEDNPATNSIPIIYLTALLGKSEERKTGHTIGGNTMIAKPYEIQEVVAEINKVLAPSASHLPMK